MRSALLLSILLLLVPCVHAQNLVPNWSFEEISECPEFLGEIEKAVGWLSFREENSCDFYHVCGLPDTTGVPSNALGWQYASHGNAYAGIHTFSGDDGWPWDYREYIGIELLEPLVVGQTYHATFKLSLTCAGTDLLPAVTRYAANNLGLLFTTSHWIQGPFDPLPERAHVRSQLVVEDTIAWTMVSGSFVADSAYRYLVVGNFFTDASTDWVVVDPDGSVDLAYYYVDEVCVSPSPQYCTLLSGVHEAAETPFRAWQCGDGALQVAGLQGSGVDRVLVLDAIGRMVVQQDVRGADTWSTNTLNWAQGVYVVVAERQDGGRIAERVFLGR